MSPSEDAPSWLHFLPVGFPSANLIVTDEGDRVLFDSQRAGWHACKRIFAFALMMHDGLPIDDLDTYLTGRQWLIDHAATVFHTTPAVLSAEILAEMRRAGAVEERDGQPYCRTPHHRPAAGLRRHSGYPGGWLGAGDP